MNRAKQIYLSIIAFCLITIFGCFYYVLGGFDNFQVYPMEGTMRTVIGKEYIGKFSSDEMRSFMEEARMLIDSSQLTGRLTLVSYQNDTIGADSSHFYIGSSFDSLVNILHIPSGYDFRKYQTPRRYKVFMTQHPLVRPSPAEVRSLLEVTAIREGQVLLPYTFELYYKDESLSVERWAKSSND